MTKWILIHSVNMLVLACQKEILEPGFVPEGKYTGTFKRETYLPTETTIVSISFSGDNWSGTGEIAKYPALCYGKFRVNSDTIVFTNECAWTAECAWTLILSGNFCMRHSGNTLELFKRSGIGNFAYTDRYYLKKNGN